jgi:acetyltransferase-like isoleucine patch superfamily enzyme
LTLGDFRIVKRLRNRHRFPGLHLADNVLWSVDGEFVYGHGAYLGESTVIEIRPGCRLSLGNRCYVGRYCEIAPDRQIHIGDQTSIQDRTVIFGNVRLGRYCTLSYNIYLSSGTHCFSVRPSWLIKDQDLLSTTDLGEEYAATRPIVIEDDCWLGINVVVLAGVTIGKGCVVGANAVVTHSLPPYSIAVGSPARVIQQRLRFVAARAVSYDRDQDLPYFYSGFLVAQSELAPSRRLGGIHALACFALWLDRAQARRVHVRARAVGQGTCELRHGSQMHPLGTDLATLVFDLAAGEGPLDFSIHPQVSGPALLVEAAWVD